MPRPYGWIRGEGTTKNQRWGLGSLMDTPVIPKLGFSGMGDIVVGDGQFHGAPCPGPGCSGYVEPNSNEYIKSLQDELASLYTYPTGTTDVLFADNVAQNNMSSWISQNSTLLVVGGIIGLLLFKR